MRNAAPGHIPPKLDHHGFERKQHNLIVNKRVDRLQNVEMPQNWQQPPRFSTRSQLRQTRASEMLPHASFDVDGDGFVGAKDYAIAKKHDLADSGRLTGGQRDSAIAETCRITGSSLRDDEIGGNTKARRVLTSLRDTPELADAQRREQRLRVGQSASASLTHACDYGTLPPSSPPTRLGPMPPSSGSWMCARSVRIDAAEQILPPAQGVPQIPRGVHAARGGARVHTLRAPSTAARPT